MYPKARNTVSPLFVLGIIGVVIFGIALFVLILVSLILFHIKTLPMGMIVALALLLVFVLVSIIGIVRGGHRQNLIGRMSKYMAMFDPKTVLSIDEISYGTGYSGKQIKKDLKEAVKSGLRFDMRADFDENSLIKGETTWQQYVAAKELRKKMEIEERESLERMDDPNLAPFEAFRREGNSMLTQIKSANIALPGEEISMRLSALERTLGQIIRHVEQYPEKLPETRKLMGYHLPATLSIVEKYREYETLEFKSQSVIDAQKEIETMLGTVDAAFKKYLDKLMEFDTLDVTTDIEVLKQMLEKDGLSGGISQL